MLPACGAVVARAPEGERVGIVIFAWLPRSAETPSPPAAGMASALRAAPAALVASPCSHGLGQWCCRRSVCSVGWPGRDAARVPASHVPAVLLRQLPAAVGRDAVPVALGCYYPLDNRVGLTWIGWKAGQRGT